MGENSNTYSDTVCHIVHGRNRIGENRDLSKQITNRNRSKIV